MKLRPALVAAALVAIGLGAAQAAPAETELKRWIVGTRRGAATQASERMRTRAVTRFTSIDAYAARMTETEAAELRRSGDVRYVEPDVERFLYASPKAGPRREALDTAAPLATIHSAAQVTPYGVDLVRARDLWAYGRGAGIKVAVIDTGIDYRHSELKKVYKGGIDFANGDNDPMDDNRHGTHVAGTIAAADDLVGVVGIAPEVELYAVKMLNASGKGVHASDVVKAVEWAMENDIDVMNMSFGGPDFSQPEQEVIDRAFAKGILTVAASGNDFDGVESMGYPASYPNVVAVGAIDQKEVVAAFSQRGPNLALVAPGVAVRSTAPLGSGAVADVAIDGELLPEVEPLEGSPLGEVTARFVDCGLGRAADFPASVSGKIALIKRGELTFNEKARNALAAGATGVIIYNNKNEPLSFTLLRPGFDDTFPPTVAITMTAGENLLKKPGATVDLVVVPFDYATMQGTSMATPHVAGVAALVWSLAPTASVAQVREALVTSGRDMGTGGWDSTYGYGVVDAIRAARTLAPQVFGTPARRRTTAH